MTKLILVGGFLGAGKTTLLLAAAKRLAAQGLRIGIVTNDQADDLVDTALVRRAAVPVAEVAGGCFCCRYTDLLGALAMLRRTVQPDVILAEPVGSCTDLTATVVRPLVYQQGGAEGCSIAPLTVLLDPQRSTDAFAPTVDYIYQRQLAEAELLVLAKQDLPATAQQRDAAAALALRYGPQRVFPLSARTGAGVDAWLDAVRNSTTTASRALEVDYAMYAAGEAALGWLNAEGTLQADQPFQPHNWLRNLLRLLEATLAYHRAPVAHVKAQIAAGDAVWKASLTATGAPLLWDVQPVQEPPPTTAATFLLNARVQTTPEQLESIVRTALAELCPPGELHCTLTRLACFSPAEPRPTHRLQAATP